MHLHLPGIHVKRLRYDLISHHVLNCLLLSYWQGSFGAYGFILRSPAQKMQYFFTICAATPPPYFLHH